LLFKDSSAHKNLTRLQQVLLFEDSFCLPEKVRHQTLGGK
jgi:hypothetical protein